MASMIKHINRYAVTASDLELFANFHYPPNCQDGRPKGIFICYHGGGVIMGSRDEEFVFDTVKRAALDNGYILIAPGYRLLVPTSGHEIVSDVKSFLDYLASDTYAKTVPSNVKPDLNKIVISGYSGGGYVARLATIDLLESAKAGRRHGLTCVGVAIYFGMGGDVFQPEWIKDDNSRSAEDAFKATEPIYSSGEISDCPYTAGLKGWENKEKRDILWDWFRDNGLFVDVLAGTKGAIRDAFAAFRSSSESGSSTSNEEVDVSQFVPVEHHPVVPQIWFSSAFNARSFPPSIYVHGTADPMVPYSETALTVHQLRKAGNENVELIAIEGVDHDLKIPGETECGPEVEEAHRKVADFILRSLAA